MSLSIRHDHTGAVFTEFAILLPIVVLVVCGSIDFLYAFYQLNAAAKATEVGARIASVSDPVASGLNDLPDEAVLNGEQPRGPLPSFTVTCSDGRCSCAGTCTGMIDNPSTRRPWIASCMVKAPHPAARPKPLTRSACAISFRRLRSANVVIVYAQTGLGYAGRPGGPVPTDHGFIAQYAIPIFLFEPLLGVQIAMPPMSTTVTGQDLCSAGGNGACGS